MPSQIPGKVGLEDGGGQQKLTAHFAFRSIQNLKFDVYHETRRHVSCLAQTGFAAFGKGVQSVAVEEMLKSTSQLI